MRRSARLVHRLGKRQRIVADSAARRVFEHLAWWGGDTLYRVREGREAVELDDILEAITELAQGLALLSRRGERSYGHIIGEDTVEKMGEQSLAALLPRAGR